VAERLNKGLGWAAERRGNAVATAVVMPGMSMQKVADELGVSKSMVAKLAGPATVRDEIAADMRRRLRSEFEYGAQEGSGPRQ
jgi:transcriptional regulator with XRE-family HTH domain